MTALNVLIDTARATFDGETRRLAEELGNARAAEERLALLERFRFEYEGRFRQRSSLGFSPDVWRNYRIFLGQLDAAIEAQRRELRERRETAEQRRASQANAGKRLRSYECLAERREEERRTEQERREQKTLDEHAARRAAHWGAGA